MSAAPDLIREEIALQLSQVAAFAAAGSAQAQVGNDHALAFEVRCAAASLMAVAGLVEHLRPSRQQQGERAA
ncbi:hypothetical protein ASG52_24795 [Methylobacterium sp. Leaf456]|uniref:hypothetical protein n=1 Tax=Methylobacterium sp. Leaf456 TaxID=1736382 RepID=UPI0006FF2C74|nr:hypothetical protein [Methylobacterium sp. Leaf456]KQT55424.1 hypothetical protein ASG52_24795 [Methylobacterium sp. Leaf456]